MKLVHEKTFLCFVFILLFNIHIYAIVRGQLFFMRIRYFFFCLLNDCDDLSPPTLWRICCLYKSLLIFWGSEMRDGRKLRQRGQNDKREHIDSGILFVRVGKVLNFQTFLGHHSRITASYFEQAPPPLKKRGQRQNITWTTWKLFHYS